MRSADTQIKRGGDRSIHCVSPFFQNRHSELGGLRVVTGNHSTVPDYRPNAGLIGLSKGHSGECRHEDQSQNEIHALSIKAAIETSNPFHDQARANPPHLMVRSQFADLHQCQELHSHGFKFFSAALLAIHDRQYSNGIEALTTQTLYGLNAGTAGSDHVFKD